MMKIKERYFSDPAFSRIVDMMLAVIMEGQFTPTEIREAAMLAQIRYEELFPRPIVFSKEDIASGKV